MADDALDAALAKAQQLARASPAPESLPPPDQTGEDLGLGVPAPAPPATIDQVAEATKRLALLQGTDTSTGAPWQVRGIVGAAPPEDRLANLRRYYPDAEPLPGSGHNFVFTNAQGKRQTYEPMGWRVPTWGDWASLGPEAAETLGGIGGAALAAPTLNPAGIAAGGGLGAAAGKSAYEGLMRSLGMIDTRTPGQQALDTATTGALNAVLPAAGERVLGPVIHSLLAPGAPTGTQTAARNLDLSGLTTNLEKGLPPSVAAESTPWSRVEQPVLSMPFTGGLRETYSGTRAGLEAGVESAATRAAGGQQVPPPDTFASTVSNIADNIHTNWLANREAADTTATNLIGANRQVDLTPLRTLRAQLQAQLDQAPEAQAGRYGGAIDEIDKILRDAQAKGGTLNYETVGNVRTDLGQKIFDTQRGRDTGVPSTGVPSMQAVYGALKDSLTGAAQDADRDTLNARLVGLLTGNPWQGPLPSQALAAHDAMVTAYRAPGGPAETLQQLMDPATRADRLTRMMQSTAPEDQASLGHLVQYATPAQRQQLAAGTIEQMGQNPADKDAGFDMTRWMSNYKRMTQPAKDMMFGPTGSAGSLQGALDDLATVQRSMGASAANKNFSNTAPTFAINTALAAITGALAGGKIGAAAASTLPLVAPATTGKLMTSQPFVRWLTGTWGVNGNDAAQWAAHLARLGTVAKADPSVASLVSQLRQQLPDQLPAAPPPPQ